MEAEQFALLGVSALAQKLLLATNRFLDLPPVLNSLERFNRFPEVLFLIDFCLL